MIPRYKKVPYSNIASFPKNELLIAKDGNDVRLFTRLDGKIYETSLAETSESTLSDGTMTFLALTDTDPTTYTGNAGKAIIGNVGEDGLTFGQAIRTTDTPTFAGIIISAVTSGNVLVANGTAFVGVTPDSGGLVTKAGTQTISGAKTFSEHVVISTGKEFRMYDADDSNYVGFVAGSLSANKVWTLPTADGSNGQALVTNGSAVLSFATVTTNAGGSDTQVQFNDGGTAFGGDAGLTYNKTTNVLTITSGALVTPKIYPASDSTTAVQILKADGTTNVLNVDTTNVRVGIGTSSPGSSLHVIGDATVVLPAVGAGSYFTIGSSTASAFNTRLGTTAANQYGWFTNIYYNGAAFVQDDATKGSWRMTQVVQFDPQMSFDYAAPGGALTTLFKIDDGGGISVGYGTTSGPANGAIINGNVGIGTDNPAEKFHVVGSGGGGVLVGSSGGYGKISAIGTNQGLEFQGSQTAYSGAYMIMVSSGAAVDPGSYIMTHGDYNNPAPSSKFQVRYANNGAITEQLIVTSGGLVGIGTTSPSTLLHSLLNNATTNAVDNVVTIGHNSTGTPAAGFGAGLLFTLESSTTADQNAARFTVAWKVATHASRTVTSKWLASDFNGEREGLCVESDGTQALIGAYGVAAVARPSALTQTYSTADRTHAARTASTLTDNSAGTANTTIEALPDPADSPASADALRDDIVTNLIPALRNNFADLAAQINALKADGDDTAQFVNSMADDLQSEGWLQ